MEGREGGSEGNPRNEEHRTLARRKLGWDGRKIRGKGVAGQKNIHLGGEIWGPE